MKKVNCLFWLLLLLLLPTLIEAQISITYNNPDGFSVCDTVTYEVTVTNNNADSIQSVLATIDLPMGIDYVPGSINNGTESDISDLNVPVFALENLLAGNAVTFTFDGFYKCELIDNINNGTLFSNDITIDYMGGSQSTTTSPYIIETALLIITGTTNDNLTGTKGDILTRTITIQNTRLGALSSFNFIDQHGGGIEITTDLGTLTNSGPNFTEFQLGPEDFMTVGDGDGLFELNEVITITESILITTCGFDQSTSNSNLEVNWGCGGEICQNAVSFAVVQFIPSTVNPLVLGTTNSALPTNFCAEIPANQTLTVSNTGQAPAIDINVKITQDSSAPVNGMHPGSFVLDSMGVITMLNPNFQLPIDFDGCSQSDLLYQEAFIIIPYLDIGESVTISWDNYSCAQGCGSPVLGFLYEIEYELSCPEDELITTTGSNIGDLPPGDLMIDTVTFAIGEVILDNTTHQLDYGLGSDFLDDSTGTLNLEFIIPCGFTWDSSNDLVLGGQSPINFDIQTTPFNSIVTIEYDLPMDSDSVYTSFDLTFSCDAPCLPPAQYIENFNTSCPPLDICVGDTIYNDTMSVNTAIILDTTSVAFCAIQECQEFPLQYVCYNGIITQIYPPGYLDFELSSLRDNFGFADNDDNRIADSSGDVDLDLVRQDRLIPGDILKTEIEGPIIMDIPDSSFTLGSITVNIESHSADDDIDNGFWLAEQDAPLMSQGGIVPLDAKLRIYDSSEGDYYTCDVNPSLILHDLRAVATVPNTRPEEILDEVVYTSYTYDISIASLQGCIPSDYLYEAGDSIQFVARHQMIYNPREDLGPYPMIVNMRTGTAVSLSNPGEENFICNCPSTNWQYSPYRYRIFPGQYNIYPCETFDEPGGQRFEMFLGEGNFFPFEVRPLAYIDEWNMTIPSEVTLLESTLSIWQVQEGATLASNVELTPDGEYGPDFPPYQNPLIDEGFFFELDHLFDSDCYQEDGLTMIHQAKIDFADNLPEIPDPLDTTTVVNGAFIPLRPNLNLNSVQPNFVSYDNSANWIFSLTNNPSNYPEPAENVWITITSPTGLLDNFQLIDLNTGQEIIPVNGIYQLGTFNVNQSNNYQLFATTNSCELEQLIVNYGWNCDPYTMPGQVPCDQDEFIFTVISPRGELEMNVVSPLGPNDLCDTIPYHTVEVFNAQIGAVFNLTLDVTMPQGMIILPGSSQIAYPTGTTFLDVSDPVDIGGGIFQYNISVLNDSIAMRGLSGISFAPDHSVSIRFLSGTECGFIAGSQLIFTANATQNCNEPTNTITKAGEELQIIGVTPPYQSELFITTDGNTNIGCEDEFTMTITMQADGATLSNDSLFITLPPGVIFDVNSYMPISNAPTDGPLVSVNDSMSQVLAWEIPAGIPANNLISFEITLLGFADATCGEHIIHLQSVQEQTALCVATGEPCTVFAETGSAMVTVNNEQPIIDIVGFGGTQNNGVFTFDLDISNSSSANGNGLTIDFYVDLDGDGVLSAGDMFITTYDYFGTLSGNAITSILGTFNLDQAYMCSLLAVIDEAENCACNSTQSAIQSSLNNILPGVMACPNQQIEIGIPGDPGNTYLWTANFNVDCLSCPTTTTSIPNSTGTQLVLNATLSEIAGTCSIEHQLSVTVYPESGIIEDQYSICPGDEVTLLADPGTSYNWSGPDIIDPLAASQTVSPAQTSTYTLTITDVNNCMNIDQALVTVFDEPNADAGPDEEYCDEDEVTLNPFFDPNYTYEWSPAGQLSDPNSQNPTITINQDETYTLIVTDQNNCTSADEVTITFNEGPDLVISEDTETCDGGTVILEVSGASDYEWDPPVWLNCTTCATVEATPEATTLYTVTGIDENGCENQISVLVEVVPSALEEDIEYLCEGDTIILFEDQIVFSEGIYCDTIFSTFGCDTIQCIEVIEADLPDFAFPEDITIEQGEDITLDLNPDYTYIFEPAGIIPDCPGCTEVTFNLDETQEFSVTIITEEGCTDEQVFRVTAFICAIGDLGIPSAFTPNGDGFSDKFGLFPPEDHIEAVQSLKIFNRWGSIVYEGSGIDACWDGTYKGKPAAADVYVYIMVVNCGLKTEEVHGDLTLVR